MSDPVGRDRVYGVVAAFAARLAGLGVTDVVVSPGSRSTALALCFDAQPALRTWIQLDERSAGFFALGLGRATGRPAILVCTSGTAAANYLPAVVEASYAGVPMIVCTADRPPELRDGWGASQTIDQVGLYGSAVRWSIDLPVPEQADPAAAVDWADEAVASATGTDPGPVHLNWPMREPLEPVGDVPVVAAGRSVSEVGVSEPVEDVPVVASSVEAIVAVGDAATRPDSGDSSAVSGIGGVGGPAAQDLRALAGLAEEFERGVVVVGPWPGGGLGREVDWASEAVHFAAWAGWPVIGEPISHVRGERLGGGGCGGGARRCVVTTADHLLADRALGDELAPDVVVIAGRPVTTKPVSRWIERTRPRHVVLIDPEDRWQRAVFRVTGHVPGTVQALRILTVAPAPAERAASVEWAGRTEPGRTEWAGRTEPGRWLHTWRSIDAAARRVLDTAIDGGPLLSAQTVRTLVGALPPGSALAASNSMPVRDLDAFVHDTGSVRCAANRGAAGIDGTVSTALGIAAADPSNPVALYCGDLALLHDLGGLAAAGRLGLHLIAVCVDNDGGEIFSLLPVADRIPAPDFERLFRTPHGLDLSRLDGFGGIRARRPESAAALRSAVEQAAAERTPGVDLLIVEIPRDQDVAQRRALSASAQDAARRVQASPPVRVEPGEAWVTPSAPRPSGPVTVEPGDAP